jgi:hypothetical protein
LSSCSRTAASSGSMRGAVERLDMRNQFEPAGWKRQRALRQVAEVRVNVWLVAGAGFARLRTQGWLPSIPFSFSFKGPRGYKRLPKTPLPRPVFSP